MKLTIKTLSQTAFKVDIEPEKTVKELKELIEKEHGKDYPCGSQKLIYNGKILVDENKLSEYQFDEKKFVVLMITRPPPPPKQTPAPVTAPASSSSTSSDQASNNNGKQKNDEKSKATLIQQQIAADSLAAASLASVSSGHATTTSSTSSTANAQQSRNESNTQARQRQPVPADMSALAMGEPQVAARLAALMTQPHFRQMQDLIQQSPHLLGTTLESLAASDPDMYNFMSENPDVFVSALNHPPLPGVRAAPASHPTPASQNRQLPQGRSGSQQTISASGGGGQQQQSSGMGQLLGGVSEHDKEAIERLKELGFSEYLAIQAYMACDKDEQLAANLLFQMDQ